MGWHELTQKKIGWEYECGFYFQITSRANSKKKPHTLAKIIVIKSNMQFNFYSPFNFLLIIVIVQPSPTISRLVGMANSNYLFYFSVYKTHTVAAFISFCTKMQSFDDKKTNKRNKQLIQSYWILELRFCGWSAKGDWVVDDDLLLIFYVNIGILHKI